MKLHVQEMFLIARHSLAEYSDPVYSQQTNSKDSILSHSQYPNLPQEAASLQFESNEENNSGGQQHTLSNSRAKNGTFANSVL